MYILNEKKRARGRVFVTYVYRCVCRCVKVCKCVDVCGFV